MSNLTAMPTNETTDICQDVMENCKACQDALQIGIAIGVAITILGAVGILIVYALVRKCLRRKTGKTEQPTVPELQADNKGEPLAIRSGQSAPDHQRRRVLDRDRLPTPKGSPQSVRSYEKPVADAEHRSYEIPTEGNRYVRDVTARGNDRNVDSGEYENVHDYLTPVTTGEVH